MAKGDQGYLLIVWHDDDDDSSSSFFLENHIYLLYLLHADDETNLLTCHVSIYIITRFRFFLLF